jgi:BCCT family betaine/carnitine transporter
VGIGENASLFGWSIGWIAPLLLVVFIILAFIFGATTLDSSAFTLASVATEEQQDATTEPARWHRLFWAIVLAGVSLALMYLGGLKPLQTASIVVALPLMVVLVIMVMSFFRWLEQDYPSAGAERTVSVNVADSPAPGDD